MSRPTQRGVTESNRPLAGAGEGTQTQAWRGLLVRKPRWGLSWRGKLLAVAVGAGLVVGVFPHTYSFLAPTEIIAGDVMVQEGWTPPNTLRQAADEFHKGHYARLLLVRPIVDVVDKYESGRYSGDFMANLLVEYGVPRDKVVTLYPIVTKKDRTYHSALAAKDWLDHNGYAGKPIDVSTIGPHARRSRLLYQKAFGDQVRIGIIALEDRTYDSTHWWRSSEGVREVIGETIAYIYARVFFHAND